jgi:hypothetical protein
VSCYPFQSPLRQEQVLSRESIIAEIRKDVALMEHIIKLLGGVKMVSIDEVVGKPRKARRSMSAAARRRISKVQKARWSKWKAAKKKKA